MKRRKFFKKTAKGALGASLIPLVGTSCATTKKIDTLAITDTPSIDKNPQQWHQMGHGKKPRPDRKRTKTYEVAVIGGGAAGICAAVAAARNGAKVVLKETYRHPNANLFEVRCYS